MNGDGRAAGAASRWRLASAASLQQWIKVLVYGLLLLNFAYYFAEELEIASHTARASWSLLQWSAAFTTSIDELAWFLLLFLFELETYLISDTAYTRPRILLMHALRLVCSIVVVHTVYANLEYARSLERAEAISVAGLCDLAGRDITFTRNLRYSVFDATNCAEFSNDSHFFLFGDGALVTDRAGMQLERRLAQVDVIESAAWLLVVVLSELLVRLQERGIAAGKLLRAALASKVTAYAVLWCAAAYWASLGHWVYAWDETLWILGFVAIDMNLSEWRSDIRAEA